MTTKEELKFRIEQNKNFMKENEDNKELKEYYLGKIDGLKKALELID